MKIRLMLALIATLLNSSITFAETANGDGPGNQTEVRCEEIYSKSSTLLKKSSLEVGDLFSFKEYRKYNSNIYATVLTYPIMLAAGTFALVTIVPFEAVKKHIQINYYENMAEFIAGKESKKADKMEEDLYSEISKVVKIDRDNFKHVLLDLKSSDFFCPQKEQLLYTDKGIAYLDNLGVKNEYELNMQKDQTSIKGFYNNPEHFELKMISMSLTKKEAVKKLIEQLKSKE